MVADRLAARVRVIGHPGIRAGLGALRGSRRRHTPGTDHERRLWTRRERPAELVADRRLDCISAQAGLGQPGDLRDPPGRNGAASCLVDIAWNSFGEPVWSPDGSQIAYTDAVNAGYTRFGPSGQEIFVVNADGSAVQRLTEVRSEADERQDSPLVPRMATRSCSSAAH